MFHLLHLSWHKGRLTQHSPALLPSTVVNTLIMCFFSQPHAWHSGLTPPQQVGSAVVVHAMKVNNG